MSMENGAWRRWSHETGRVDWAVHEGTQIALTVLKYPGESPTVYKNQALFSLNVTPYFAPKDVKNFSIIEEFFARVKQVWLSWVSIQRCKAVQEIINIIT